MIRVLNIFTSNVIQVCICTKGNVLIISPFKYEFGGLSCNASINTHTISTDHAPLIHNIALF